MPALALEVNDAGLLLLPEGHPRPEESPCLAVFEGGEVLTGSLAASRAHVRPRGVHDAYLDPLDTEPLGRPFPAGIRRADLAYAHLTALRDVMPAESEVFLAVPGFWSAESLGLLLGVAGAAGLRVAGLVDAAVAGASLLSGGRPSVHVDLTRHRVVVTALDVSPTTEGAPGAEIERGRVASAENAGRKAFEDRLAREIAALFVAETRFDPLHSGASEQALRDALPGWLRELRRLESCEASLTAGGREHKTLLSRESLAQATSDLQRAVAREVQALAPEGEGPLLVSARVSGIPGLVEHLRDATGCETVELPHDGAVSATLRHRDRLRHEGPALPFVTRLPGAGGAAAVPVRPGPRPTHLLHSGVAHVLGPAELALGTTPPLGIRGLALRREDLLPHHASIRVEDGELFVVDKAPGRTFLNGEAVDGRRALRAGDRLRLGDPGVELLLVAIAGEESRVKRRKTEVFGLSFLDCICCGFGATVLIYMILNSGKDRRAQDVLAPLRAETNRLEEQVLEGQENLVELRNTLERVRQEEATTRGLSTRLIDVVKQSQDELATFERETIARREHVNKLQADLRSLEEGSKRLSGGPPSREVPGDKVRSFVGDGDRQYLTGFKVGGRRILLLVDASASMLADTVVNAVRRRLLPEADRMRADKWRRAVRAADWLTTQLPREASFQLYVFDTEARPVLPGTEGTWLEAKDRKHLDAAVARLRSTAPQGGTSLEKAFAAAAVLRPPPDNILLLTDGLPTQGVAPPRGRTVSGKERARLFDRAVQALPRGVPVNTLLFPMEGDPVAAPAFWKLAMATNGSFMTPSRDWP